MIRFALVLAALCLLAGCGGTGTTQAIPSPEPTIDIF